MSFSASMSMHNETHQAEDTDASVKIAFTENGFCPTHPDILLRQKIEPKFWGRCKWEVILPRCPWCEIERQQELENQRRDSIQPALLPAIIPDPTAPPQSAESTTSLATSGPPLDDVTPEDKPTPTDAKGKDTEQNPPGNSDNSPKSDIIADTMPKKESKNDNNYVDAAVWRLDGGKLLRGIRCFIPEDNTFGFQVNDYLKSCNIFLQVPTIHPENDLKASDCEEKQLFFMASDSSKAKIEALIKTCGLGYVADFDTFANASSRTSSFSSAVDGNGKDNGPPSPTLPSMVSAASSDGWFLSFTEKKERVIVLPFKDMMPSEDVCDEASRVTDRSSALRFLKRYGSHVPAGDQVLGGYSLRWAKAKGKIRVAEAALVVGDSSDVSQRNTETSVEATSTSDESSKEATNERDSVASQHAEGTQQRAGSMVEGEGSPCVVSRGDVGAFVPVWRVLEKIKNEEQDGCSKFSTAIELLRDTWHDNLLNVTELLLKDSILSHGDYFMRMCEILVQEDASKGGSFTSSDANSFIRKLREKVNPPPPSPPSPPDKSPALPPAPRYLPVETTPYPMYVVERERRSIARLLSFLRNTCKLTAAHAKEVTIAFLIKKGIFSEEMLVALVKSSWFKERRLQSIVGNKNVAHIIADATANRAVPIPKPIDILEDEKLLLQQLGEKLAMDADDVVNLTDLYIAMINNVPMLSCVAISLCEHIYHSMKTVHTATICKILKATYPPNDLTNVYKAEALAGNIEEAVVDEAWNELVTSFKEDECSIEAQYVKYFKAKDYTRAVALCLRTATKGDFVAQNYLGYFYMTGHGIAKIDYQKSFHWFEKAANQRWAGAQYNLGVCYSNGHGVAQNKAKAAHLFTLAAKQGHANAQYCLGDCYQHGEGVAEDYSKAVHWYSKAANQGHARAQCSLGMCYDNGWGVEKKDYAKALHWYTKAANQGDATAQLHLGDCYVFRKGVDQDYTKAAHWFQKAAQQGLAMAQFSLAVCYDQGYGRIPSDVAKAVHWYTKAAEQNVLSAQFNLGVSYFSGSGVTQDFGKAVFWYLKAAGQGHAAAQNNLGYCYEKGHGVEPDPIKAFQFYQEAARRGYSQAMYNLGYCYEHGLGIAMDASKAQEWRGKAAATGHVDCR